MTTHSSPDPWLDDLETEVARRLDHVAQVLDDLDSLTAEATSTDGGIRVQVNPAGRPTAIILTTAATAIPADELAARLLATIDAAAESAANRLHALVGELVPAVELDAMLSRRPAADSWAAS